MTNKIEDFIKASGLAAGDRLPPERELAESMGLPRTTVRRMLAEMVNKDMVTRHVGRGTFIAGADEPDIATTRKKAGLLTYPAEIFEARLMMEPEVARLAALRATHKEISDMEKILDKCRNAESFAEFEKLDGVFHAKIVAAARNALISVLYEAISAVRSGKLWGKMKEKSLTKDSVRDSSNQHDAILNAIADRDGDMAFQLMKEHILISRNRHLQL